MNIEKLKEEAEAIKAREAVNKNLSQADVNDTQNEFWNVDGEMRTLIKDMTVGQREKLNKMIAKFKDKNDASD